jgi:hypothetical protein
MTKPRTTATKPDARTKGKPGRPPSANPRPHQIQVRATEDEWALWGRINASRSAAAGVGLSQQQVFRWMMAHAAEHLGCAGAQETRGA